MGDYQKKAIMKDNFKSPFRKNSFLFNDDVYSPSEVSDVFSLDFYFVCKKMEAADIVICICLT